MILITLIFVNLIEHLFKIKKILFKTLTQNVVIMYMYYIKFHDPFKYIHVHILYIDIKLYCIKLLIYDLILIV